MTVRSAIEDRGKQVIISAYGILPPPLRSICVALIVCGVEGSIEVGVKRCGAVDAELGREAASRCAQAKPSSTARGKVSRRSTRHQRPTTFIHLSSRIDALTHEDLTPGPLGIAVTASPEPTVISPHSEVSLFYARDCTEERRIAEARAANTYPMAAAETSHHW